MAKVTPKAEICQFDTQKEKFKVGCPNNPQCLDKKNQNRGM